jgi:hypothetical protein
MIVKLVKKNLPWKGLVLKMPDEERLIANGLLPKNEIALRHVLDQGDEVLEVLEKVSFGIFCGK